VKFSVGSHALFSRVYSTQFMNEVVFIHGDKCAIFYKMFNHCKDVIITLDGGRSAIKSKDINFHGPTRIGNGCNTSYGRRY
jgi:hypothetical protein